MYRKHKHSTDPADIRQSVDDIHATLEHSGLHRETSLILGGAALAMHGIRTAKDVDAQTTMASWRKLHQSRRTQAGGLVVPKLHTERLWLEVSHPSAPLDMDLTTTVPRVDADSSHADTMFTDVLADMPLSSEGWHYLDTETLRESLKRFGTRRHKKDIKRL